MNSNTQEQQDRKKLEDDPYYIPSVPMYRVLGEEMDDTIGDLFFDQHPSKFQRSPPRGFYENKENKEKEAVKGHVKLVAALSKFVVDESQPGDGKPHRRSRSLMKPGYPSLASAPTGNVKPQRVSLPKLGRPTVANVPTQNVFATKKPTATPIKPINSPMRLRSDSKKEGDSSSTAPNRRVSPRGFYENKEKEPIKEHVKLVATLSKFVVGESQPGDGKPHRRSRSLMKPGYPSLASAPTGNAKPQRVSLLKPGRPTVANVPTQNVFATKKPTATPIKAVNSPMRLRSDSKKEADSSSTAPNRRVSNYMAPTLASARRVTDAKDRRSRLPNQK